jgi:protein-S-isoprenylcysteine O-methyltransferase Ste14
MTDAFRAAKLARKKRTKWWREHDALAGVILLSAFALLFLCIRFVDLRLPGWLTALGVSPSGVHFLFGTAACALGVWGIRTKGNGAGLTLVYVLCLLEGVFSLAKAFALF